MQRIVNRKKVKSSVLRMQKAKLIFVKGFYEKDLSNLYDGWPSESKTPLRRDPKLKWKFQFRSAFNIVNIV